MYGDLRGLQVNKGITGPWRCSECGELSQYGDIEANINRIFCKNPTCRFERIVDKRRCIIKENDGTFWRFDSDGHKVRISGQ